MSVKNQICVLKEPVSTLQEVSNASAQMASSCPAANDSALTQDWVVATKMTFVLRMRWLIANPQEACVAVIVRL